MSTVTRKRYTPESKAQAVEPVAIGKPAPEVAEELGIGTSLLYQWSGKNPPPVPSLGGRETTGAELARLRRENSHLKLENDILEKAAIILGTKPQGPLTR